MADPWADLGKISRDIDGKTRHSDAFLLFHLAAINIPCQKYLTAMHSEM